MAWYIAPYVRDDVRGHGQPSRFCTARDGVGGSDFYASVEILGNYAICKVRANQATLDALAALPNVDRIPKNRLDDSLSDFTPAQKLRMRDIALGLGYTLQEINARFPNDLGTYTLGDVLKFLAKRWKRPRYNVGTDEILFDTPPSDPPSTVEWVADAFS